MLCLLSAERSSLAREGLTPGTAGEVFFFLLWVQGGRGVPWAVGLLSGVGWPSSGADLGPGAAAVAAGADPVEAAACSSAERSSVAVNVYGGKLPAGFSLTGRFAGCFLLPLELMLAPCSGSSELSAPALLWP